MANLKEAEDRRKLGINFLSIFRSARKVLADPTFVPKDTRDIAVAVLEDICSKKFKTLKRNNPEIDWDKLLEFIEKIIALILQLLSIFTFEEGI